MTGYIRPMTRADAPQYLDDLIRLRSQLSDSAHPTTKTTVTRSLRHPSVCVFGAFTDDGTLVGMATLGLLPYLGKTKGYIEDVIVDERYRGQAFGSRLMRELIEFAEQHGAANVELTSRPERTEANLLYQKLGFEPRKTNLYRRTFLTDEPRE